MPISTTIFILTYWVSRRMIIDFDVNVDGLMSYNQSNSIIFDDDIGMNIFSYSCGDPVSLLLRIHFVFTWSLFLMLIFNPVIVLSMVARIIWIIINQRHPERSLQRETRLHRRHETLSEHHLQQIDSAVVHEVKLIVFYVSASSIFELIKGNSLRWISLARWLIEASSIPVIILLAVIESVLFLARGVFADDGLWMTYMWVYVSKFILWIIMRYIEIYPSSTIKNYSILRFSHFCNFNSSHRIHVVDWTDRNVLFHLFCSD